MNRIYLFLVLIALSVVACISTDTQETTETTTDAPYETVVINGDLPSPKKEMRAKMGENTLTITYGSPSVKGRTIWGDLVPYDKVWRTGANEATTFENSVDVKVEGQALPAGKYGMFVIPAEEGNWTVIFNSVHEQWGAYDYDETKDVLRVEVSTKSLDEVAETMDFALEDESIVLKWNKLALPVKINI